MRGAGDEGGAVKCEGKGKKRWTEKLQRRPLKSNEGRVSQSYPQKVTNGLKL